VLAENMLCFHNCSHQVNTS